MRNERHPLIGARIKLERADKHITDFQELSLEWKLKPHGVRVKRDAVGREYLEPFLENSTVWNDPTWIALCCTAGDAIHNLRSTLDHIAYAVAWKRKGSLPSLMLKKVNFLVRKSGAEFNRVAGGQRAIGDDWVKFMRSNQPYSRRNGLWRLNQLDNLDKHRELLSLTPVRKVSVLRKGETELQRSVTSFKKGVMAGPSETDSMFIGTVLMTLANTGLPYDKQKDAFDELLSFRSAICAIVSDAEKTFFS
jgi:hypothetical protein